jgi:serine/threonine protein kinase
MADWDPLVNEIFLGALEQGGDRQAYLDRACGDNAGLRRAVEALLAAHDQAGQFLEVPPSSAGQTVTQAEGQPAKDQEAGDDPDTDDDGLSYLAASAEPGSLGRLDHYEILSVAGRGAMGVVFKAKDTKLQRIVALKILAPALAADGTARKRFVREAQAAAAVRDDHVVGIHAVNDDSRMPYLVMEYIEGTTLAARIKREGALELKEILRIGMQAAAGLAAAHKQGLVHRDIKPANILLENGVQRVKITDFGLARAVQNPSLTQTGARAGTPLYMSPEQARGEGVDHRSDLFSLGGVLYTMCTGRPAFPAGNPLAVLRKICDDTPQPISEANSDVPDYLIDIVDKLLAKDPSARFQTAGELAEALRGHLAQLQQPSREPRTLALAVKDTGARQRKHAGLMVVLLGVAATLVALATLGIIASGWLTRESNERAQGTPTNDTGARTKPEPSKKDTATEQPQTPKDTGKKTTSRQPPPPNVLTVSQDPDDGGQFRTISAALDAVKPGMTVRVIDDATYEERLTIDQPDRYRGVILEADEGKKPSIKMLKEQHSGKRYCVKTQNVTGFTLRGFRLHGDHNGHALVFVTGQNPGLVLERLHLVTTNPKTNCVVIWNAPVAAEAPPVIIHDCIMDGGEGIYIYGNDNDNPNAARPCSQIAIRNNIVRGSTIGISLVGDVSHIHVAANRVMDCEYTAINIGDLLPHAGDLLIANNTLLANGRAIRVWDDSTRKDNAFNRKNIRIQNNLVLAPQLGVDLCFFDHLLGQKNYKGGNTTALLESWRFSHNWREMVVPADTDADKVYWIPAGNNDRLQKPIDVMSRDARNPNFVKPPKNSPLEKGGAGVEDPALPPYVGAVPPEGTPAWNWTWTWDALIRRVLAVSVKPEDGGRFRTITEALAKVEPGMTIRVLDDGTYEEVLFIDRAGLRDVVLEAAKGKRPTIRVQKGERVGIAIKDVEGFTFRGFQIVAEAGPCDLVFVRGVSAGVVLENLEFVPGTNLANNSVGIFDLRLKPGKAPLVITNCKFQGSATGVLIVGGLPPKLETAQRSSNIVVHHNTFRKLDQAINVLSNVQRFLVVENMFLECTNAVTFADLLPTSQNLLIANNTFFRNGRALRIWDDSTKNYPGLQAKDVRLENNLVLRPKVSADFFFFDHLRGAGSRDYKAGDPGAVLKSEGWHFSHNWREIESPPDGDADRPYWIPCARDDHLTKEIKVLSVTFGDADFLRLPKTSPLATGGTGEAGLPSYVGAVPPEGANPWDWRETWKALDIK